MSEPENERNEIVKWAEPYEPGKKEVKACTVEEAIWRQRTSGLVKGYVYASDEKALEDFLVVHWGWIE